MRTRASGSHKFAIIVALVVVNLTLLIFNFGRFFDSVTAVSQGHSFSTRDRSHDVDASGDSQDDHHDNDGVSHQGIAAKDLQIFPFQPNMTNETLTSEADVGHSCPADFKHDPSSHRSFSLFKDARQLSFYDPGQSHNVTYSERILILTPISDVGNKLEHYFKNLCSLTYPHHLISIALGEDSSADKTFQVASKYVQVLNEHFQSVELLKLSEKLQSRPRGTKHDREFQRARREHLALARNELLTRSLREHDWVLWIDSDVKHIPRDIIQHLLSAKKDLVVPSCMYYMADGTMQLYDRNTWRETNVSLEFLAGQDKNFLMLEGYSGSARLYLTDLRREGLLVKVDGVGGCVLLVNAMCHKKGLIFPPFVLDNHIETEGLAKMAAHMGYQPYGFTQLKVIHF